jgi:lipid-A-disaccharide synthase-like uncharacterized protein
MIIFGVLGLLAISFAIWLKNEKKQNILFIIGGALLLVYSFVIDDIIFIILQIVFVLSALIELIKKRN